MRNFRGPEQDDPEDGEPDLGSGGARGRDRTDKRTDARSRKPAGERAATRRLERLVFGARAALLFERIWRLVLPALLVAGVFVVASWAGLWLELPRWARGLCLLGFGGALAACLVGWRAFRWPRRQEALARIDRVSRLASRPAEVLDDRLANRSGDMATAALWALHRRRAAATVASLRAGWPSPRVAEIDRYALRGLLPVALVATGFIAGPERIGRIAAAFDWGSTAGRGAERIDAWIDPPAYTGKPPVVLDLAATGVLAGSNPRAKIAVPVGSIVIVRSSSGRPPVEPSIGLTPVESDETTSGAAPGGGAPRSEKEIRLRVDADASLEIGRASTRRGRFDLVAIPDVAPTVAWTDVPRANARGSLALAYEMADDYGVIAAEARFTDPVFETGAKAQRSLVAPPRVALAVPGTTGAKVAIETNVDLSEHPWAGGRATLTLEARDAGGHQGESAPIEVRLPQKPFSNPLARALVEQRRNLVLAPQDKAKVVIALEALMLAPEAFETKAGAYLGLAVAVTRAEAARTDADLLDLADHLWAMALRIESGDLSDAERELRAAEQALRDALARNASEKEIAELTDRLRAAMEAFLTELAKQSDAPGEPQANAGTTRAMDPRELMSMLDKLQDMARSGNLADAGRMLDELQNILENLKAARRGTPDPAAREMSRALDELGKLGKDEEALRDETHRRGQDEQKRTRSARGSRDFPDYPFRPGPGADEDAEGPEDLPPEADAPEPHENAAADTEDLRARQQALRDRLGEIEKRLRQAGQEGEELETADGAMREAEAALRRGPGASDEAVEAQGRVLDALRQGAEKLAEAMQSGGQGDGAGVPETGEGGLDPGGRPQYGRRGGRDPLGRMTRGGRLDASGARYDPLGAPAAERARRVLEELRRRLGEPARPRDELDYLERLLRRY